MADMKTAIVITYVRFGPIPRLIHKYKLNDESDKKAVL